MRRRASILAILLMAVAGCDPAWAQATNYAFRVSAAVYEAASNSLPAMEWLQNSTPLVEVTVTRGGAAVAASTAYVARLTYGAALTSAPAATATNYWPATNAPTYASYRLYIGGVAGTNSKWKKVH